MFSLILRILLTSGLLAFVTSQGACQTDQECRNGGGCELLGNGERRCDCTSNYAGANCDIECPILCYNGAECVSDIDEHVDLGLGDAAFHCKCADGWFGSLCDIPVTTCADGLECFNRGTCQLSAASTDSYVCNCPDTHEGNTCLEVDAPSPTSTPPPALQQDTACSVCGVGLVVTKPDAIFAFPGQPVVACGTLQQVGADGSIGANECQLLPDLISEDCGCAPTPATPPPAPASTTASGSGSGSGGDNGKLSSGAVAGISLSAVAALAGAILVFLAIQVNRSHRVKKSAAASEAVEIATGADTISDRDIA